MVVVLSRALYAAVVLGAISVISARSAAPSEFRPLAAVGHPSQAYFGSLPPGAPLPTGSQCAEDISATPETVSGNIPFNRTMATAAQLAEFARNGYTFERLLSKAQFSRIRGDYTGSTDMIIRWAACKYGIDENIVRGQAWQESWWQQWRTGDRRESRAQCVQGNFVALWDTTVSLVDGAKVDCPKCCWTSWSAWQTKVRYEWMTWPMIKDSTSFAADFHYATTRSCVNGDWATFFSSRQAWPGHNTYAVDQANYAKDPTSANLKTVVWGCVGSHMSGEWYDRAAVEYINDIRANIAKRRWLTPNIHITGPG